MQDATGLKRVEFTDKFDLGQTEPSIYKPRPAKEVNFLDKFGDSGQISESKNNVKKRDHFLTLFN